MGHGNSKGDCEKLDLLAEIVLSMVSNILYIEQCCINGVENISGKLLCCPCTGILKVLWDDGEEGRYGLEEFDAAI